MTSGVVLDTSVILNILGSGQAEAILAALDCRKVIVTVTSREVLRHPLEPSSPRDPIAPLVAAGLVEKVMLEDAALSRFVQLAGAAPPNGLDDGEAAALAMGEALDFHVAIDEKKGRRVAQSNLPLVRLLSSGAIFSDSAIAKALGSALDGAVFSALVHARMRVLPEHDAWVRQLLGDERVAQCPSLRVRR